MGQCARIVFSVFMMLFLMSGTSFAETEDKVDKEGSSCKEKLLRVGVPSTLETIASLSAIKIWLTAAREHGVAYATWHKAEDKKITCNKREKSFLYLCFVSAKPCLDEAIPQDDKTAKKQDEPAAPK